MQAKKLVQHLVLALSLGAAATAHAQLLGGGGLRGGLGGSVSGMAGATGGAGRLGGLDAMGGMRQSGRLDTGLGRRAVDAAGEASGELAGNARLARPGAGRVAPTMPEAPDAGNAGGRMGGAASGALSGELATSGAGSSAGSPARGLDGALRGAASATGDARTNMAGAAEKAGEGLADGAGRVRQAGREEPQAAPASTAASPVPRTGSASLSIGMSARAGAQASSGDQPR